MVGLAASERGLGGATMTTRPAKIIQFPTKRRHVRGRLTATGEFLRVMIGGRGERKGGGDSPPAA